MHVWPPEQSHLVGGQMDKPYTASTHAIKFLGSEMKYDTVHIHILFGKAGFRPNKPPLRDSFESRLPLFDKVMRKAKEVAKQRVIFSDYHEDSKQFKITNLKPKTVLIETVRKALEPEFEIVEIGFSAGEGCPNRDIHIISEAKDSRLSKNESPLCPQV